MTARPRLDKYAMLLAVNNRSKAYLQGLIAAGYVPEYVIILNSGDNKLPEQTENDLINFDSTGQELWKRSSVTACYFNEKESLLKTLQSHKISYEEISTVNVNDVNVVARLEQLKAEYIVYSGPGGTILRDDILNVGKRILHVHPGILPEWCGSTTVYYAMLSGSQIGCSVIEMVSEIDKGPIFYQNAYDLDPGIDCDYDFDPLIRAQSLINFFNESFGKTPSEIRVEGRDVNTFYIIHPVLKHLAILKSRGALC